MDPIPVNIAIEDELSERALRCLLVHSDRGYSVGAAYRRGGFGYLRNNSPNWNRVAPHIPLILLTDLDRYPCPPALILDWLPEPLHSNFLFRIAVREVESWLLADRSNLAGFLRTAPKHIPVDPDLLADPKRSLIDAARRSRSKDIRERIVPKPGSTATQGREYNPCLAEFVSLAWNIPVVATHSPSLQRTIARLASFTPRYPLP